MSDWIGDTFTSDVGWAHLERLVDIGNRMAGSEREAAVATCDAFADLGLRDVRTEAFDIQGRDLSLTTHGFDGLAAAAETVADRFDHPIAAVPEQAPHSDHWPFVRRGVPGYRASSDTGDWPY